MPEFYKLRQVDIYDLDGVYSRTETKAMPDPIYSDRPVYMAAIQESIYECYTCGSYVPQTRFTQHRNFHNTFTNRGDGNMSSVLWCDKGDHPFKAGMPGALHFSGTQTGEDGRTEDLTQDICPQHNPYAPTKLREDAERRTLTAKVEEELNSDTNVHPYL